MAITKFLTNVNNIQALSDRPNTTDGLTSAELKERFDKAGADIKTYLNSTLTDEVDTIITGIQAALSSVESRIESISGQMLDFNQIYPVGAIYISTNSTNPETLFGGVWERIEDTFLLASGNTYENGSIGGEAEHQLVENELPAHSHIFNQRALFWDAGYSNKASVASGSQIKSIQWSGYGKPATTKTGGDKPHNNMPPYYAVYVWKRTM